MKNPRNILAMICMLLFVSFFQSYSQVSLAEKDAVITVKKPTSEDLYTLDCKMAEALTALKYGPSTKQSKVSYPLENTGLVANVVLYYQNKRLIRVEKRIYDKSNVQTSYNMFNFNERNGCFTNAQWNAKDVKTCILTMSEYGLIYFSSDMKLIELDSNQMQKFIQETKVSLDTVMGHFKEFKYTFEIK